MNRVVALTKAELKNGNAVVIGLQSTGEARTLEAIEEQGELDDFISTAKAQFQSMVEKHFPAPNRKKTLALLGLAGEDSKDYSDPKSRRARQETQRRIKSQSSAQSMREFIVTSSSDSDSSRTEVEDNQTTEVDSANDNSDDDFELSDDDDAVGRKSKKRKVKKKISDDEDEDDEESSTDSDDYTSEESTPVHSAEEEESDSDSEDDDPCERYGGKRSKNRKVGRKKKKKPAFGSKEAGDLCEKLRDDLMAKFDEISVKWPVNSLDELIAKLGGPSEVAEMTGRKGRIVQRDDGEIVYESRKDDTSLEMLNISEKNKFMNDEKQIAIISEAASRFVLLEWKGFQFLSKSFVLCSPISKLLFSSPNSQRHIFAGRQTCGQQKETGTHYTGAQVSCVKHG